ncbi:MAG: hypothetical protein AB1758_05040 [Candidatus Eremiobacterota bacterium]
MSKQNRHQQKIRAQKRQKRSKGRGPARAARPPGDDVTRVLREAPTLLKPYLQVRFDPEAVREEMAQVDAWARDQVQLADGLEGLGGPFELGSLCGGILTRLVDSQLARETANQLDRIARLGDRVGRAATFYRGIVAAHIEKDPELPPIAANPVWRTLMEWSAEGAGPRVRWFTEEWPDLTPLSLPEDFLRAVDPEHFGEVRAAVNAEVEFEADMADLYSLLRARAKLASLRVGLTPEELGELFGRVLLAWAARVPPSLREGFLAAFPGAEVSPDLALALSVARDVDPVDMLPTPFLSGFLTDPDSPDCALELAHLFREVQPETSRGLLEWAVGKYPGLFDAHLDLARLAAARGDADTARAQAQSCLDCLGEEVDPGIRQEFEREARALLSTLSVP